jgi:hypothetical protein
VPLRAVNILGALCLALVWGAVGQAAESPTPGTSAQSSPTATTYPSLPFFVSGTGTRNTQIFAVDSAWRLDWSFDCSPYLRVGLFNLNIYDSDGNLKQRVVDTIRTASFASMIYPRGGKYYLQIETKCDWTVRVGKT